MGLGLELECRIQALEGLGFRVYGSGFRVCRLGDRAEELGGLGGLSKRPQTGLHYCSGFGFGVWVVSIGGLIIRIGLWWTV